MFWSPYFQQLLLPQSTALHWFNQLHYNPLVHMILCYTYLITTLHCTTLHTINYTRLHNIWQSTMGQETGQTEADEALCFYLFGLCFLAFLFLFRRRVLKPYKFVLHDSTLSVWEMHIIFMPTKATLVCRTHSIFANK